MTSLGTSDAISDKSGVAIVSTKTSEGLEHDGNVHTTHVAYHMHRKAQLHLSMLPACLSPSCALFSNAFVTVTCHATNHRSRQGAEVRRHTKLKAMLSSS